MLGYQAGIKNTIFDEEASAGSRFREWTLAVHWALPIFGKILPEGHVQRMTETQCDPSHTGDQRIQIYNSKTNELLKEVPNDGMRRLSRRKLRNLCLDGLDVQWGMTLTNVTFGEGSNGVKAHFADGTTYQGSIIVGADGTRSKVRELLLGAEKAKSKPLEVVQNMTVVKYGDAAKALHVRSGNPLFYLGYHPDGIVNFVSSKPPAPSHMHFFNRTGLSQSKTFRLRIILKTGPSLSGPPGKANVTPTLPVMPSAWPISARGLKPSPSRSAVQASGSKTGPRHPMISCSIGSRNRGIIGMGE